MGLSGARHRPGGGRVFGVRLFCAELSGGAVCGVSCSKNFGLYRERTGALHGDQRRRRRGRTPPSGQLVRIARGHLVDAAGPWGRHRARNPRRRRHCARAWQGEVAAMAPADLRPAARGGGAAAGNNWPAARLQLPSPRSAACFSFFRHQQPHKGGASCVPAITSTMTDDSRINIAGLRRENLEYFARATAPGAGGPSPPGR